MEFPLYVREKNLDTEHVVCTGTFTNLFQPVIGIGVYYNEYGRKCYSK